MVILRGFQGGLWPMLRAYVLGKADDTMSKFFGNVLAVLCVAQDRGGASSIGDDADAIAGRVVTDVEINVSPAQDTQTATDYQAFLDNHDFATNATLYGMIGDRLAADGKAEEAQAFWAGRDALTQLALVAEGLDLPDPND